MIHVGEKEQVAPLALTQFSEGLVCDYTVLTWLPARHLLVPVSTSHVCSSSTSFPWKGQGQDYPTDSTAKCVPLGIICCNKDFMTTLSNQLWSWKFVTCWWQNKWTWSNKSTVRVHTQVPLCPSLCCDSWSHRFGWCPQQSGRPFSNKWYLIMGCLRNLFPRWRTFSQTFWALSRGPSLPSALEPRYWRKKNMYSSELWNRWFYLCIIV